MQIFHFLITWRSSSSKSAALYKISWKSDDFSRIYGDISICKMASAILKLFYHNTRPPTKSLLQAAARCLSNFMSIWYTDLKILLFEFFAYLTWNAYSGPKMGVLGEFGPLNVIIHHRDPQKAHPFVNRRAFSYQLVWPVGELTESVTDTQTHTGKFIFCPW